MDGDLSYFVYFIFSRKGILGGIFDLLQVTSIYSFLWLSFRFNVCMSFIFYNIICFSIHFVSFNLKIRVFLI